MTTHETPGSESTGPSLESLLSPQVPSFEPSSSTLNTRQSVAESLSDVALDDDTRFSTVTLASSDASTPDAVVDLDTQLDRAAEEWSGTPVQEKTQTQAQADETHTHKKSSSFATIRSSHRDSGLADQETLAGSEPRGNRISLDGHLKLQEDFERLHREKEREDGGANNVAIDWDFWGDVMADYQQYAADNPQKLAGAIAKGIPATLRGMMWQLMAASKEPELESKYLLLLKEVSPHEKAITRDLGRTFPHHEFFTDGQGIGQEKLFNVLKAYSLYDPEVGYCQGLHFVVAVLLLNMPDEEAFCLLVRLMYLYDLRGHFLPEMPRLQLRLYQFDRLIEELLPVLHVHFLRQGIKSSMFCSQWFLTMFSYRFPLDIVSRIYDTCLANGIEEIFGFSIVLLHKNEDLLLEMKFDDILAFLNTKLFDRYCIRENETDEIVDRRHATYDINAFVKDANSMRITSFMLDSYRHEYEENMRETNKVAVEMDELRTSNRSLSNQVKTLERSLAQLDQEHVDLLNELVKSRLKNEDTEAELVRYKLLYAEAMHKNEDAQSNTRMSMANLFKRGSA